MSVLTIHAVGDIILDAPVARPLFAPSAECLRRADVSIGQIEVPHTTSTEVWTTDVPARPASPASMTDVAWAGFDVVTLAGNHIADAGPGGIVDTVRAAHRAGLRTTGAGQDLDTASTPAILERAGRTVGVLSFNAVGPRDSWAGSRRAGAAYVEVVSQYEPIGANPGGPARVHTFCEPRSRAAFERKVREVADAVDVLVVALHKGLVHTPAELADYEREIAHAAIDAGATAVVGHHAHILRGVEIYRDRPIFHGLGNFVTVTRAMDPAASLSPEQQAWASRRRRMFGFDPDPAMPEYPFHPESRNTAIGVVEVDPDGVHAALIPCWIDDDARPVPHGPDERGCAVADYIRRISVTAGLEVRYDWDGTLLRVAHT